jgi:hypothetical protein
MAIARYDGMMAAILKARFMTVSSKKEFMFLNLELSTQANFYKGK